MKPWDRVRRFAQWAGVDVRVVDHIGWQRSAPFSGAIGLIWDDLVLLVRRHEYDAGDRETLGSSMHELGHLLASTVRPNDVGDEHSFVGWEWRVALRLGIQRQWAFSMRFYGTDVTDSDYGSLEKGERAEYLRRGMAWGRAAGNISPSGRPLMLRGPRAERSQ